MKKKEKLQWETPVLVDLDRRKAHGDCIGGSSPGLYCIDGGNAISCSQGTGE